MTEESSKSDDREVRPSMPMPGDDAPASASAAGDMPPPPGFGRQMAQLVIIPAIIVIVCIGLAIMFGILAGAQTDINANLAKLRQSSGSGRMLWDIQDPRYKDRGLAAYNIATLIPTIKDPAERARIGRELQDILSKHVGENEDMLHAYMLLALGQLGRDGAIEPILAGLDSHHASVRKAAVGGLLEWHDREAARQAVPRLQAILRQDDDSTVLTAAAAASGELALSGDEQTIAALKQVMSRTGIEFREAGWNAAVALARLGDDMGGGFVATVLLDRQSLAKMPGAESGPASQRAMPANLQDRIIISTLTAAGDMTDARVWAKISELAENDPNAVVRMESKRLISNRSDR